MTGTSTKNRTARNLRTALLAMLPLMAVSLASPAFADSAKSQDYYKDALEWLQKGDGRAALIQLRNAVKEDPENYSARLLLGRLYLETRNLPAARKELERAHAGAPSDETEVFFGRALLEQRAFDKVLEVVRPESNDLSFRLPKALLRSEAMFGLNRLEDAIAGLQPILDEQRNNPPANLLVARIKVKQNDYTAANRYIDAALAGDPNFIDAYLLQAHIAYSTQKLNQVLEILTRAQELAPTDPRPKMLRAETLLRMGRVDEAQAIAKSYQDENPNDVRTAFLLARILATQAKYQEADQELRKISEAVRVIPAASLLQGIVKFQLEQYAQAEEALVRYVRIAGTDGRQARRLLATVQMRTSRPRAAIQTLTPLIEEGSRDVASMQLAASALLRTDELDAARDMFLRIMQNGSAADALQAQAFYRALQSGKPDVTGKLTLEPAALRTVKVLDMLRNGEEAIAFEDAQVLAQEYPDDTAVANLLAGMYIGRGELDKARTIAEAALAKDPTNAATMRTMDRIDVAEGKFDAIETRMRAALEAEPKNEYLIMRLGQFLNQRGRRDEAITLLEDKRRELPQSLVLRRALIRWNIVQNNPAEVRTLAEELMALGEAGSNPAIEMAGDTYLAIKDYDKAIETFSKLVEKVGPAAELKLAQAQFQAGRLDDAAESLNALLAAQPDNRLANTSLVQLYLRRRDAEKAMAVADKAAEVNEILGLELRAEVLRQTKRVDRAIEELRNGLAKYSVSELARQTFRMLIEAGKPEEAKTVLAAWLVDHPDDPESLQLLSSRYIVEGELSAAAAYLERAYSLLPNNPVILNNLAWVRYELDRPGALAVARRAYRLAPNSAAVADTLGWILIQEGETEEGVKLLYAANDSAPTIGDITYHLAFALDKAGKKKEAVELLERAFKEGSDVTFDQEGEKAKSLLNSLKAG